MLSFYQFRNNKPCQILHTEHLKRYEKNQVSILSWLVQVVAPPPPKTASIYFINPVTLSVAVSENYMNPEVLMTQELVKPIVIHGDRFMKKKKMKI